MATLDLTTEQLLPLGLLLWYPFKKDSRVLFMGGDSEAWEHELTGKGLIVDTNPKEVYDYIILIGQLELQDEPVEYLNEIKSYLKASGHLFIAVENRLGLRYFCGDKDPYTGRVFDSIEGYKQYLKEDWALFEGRLFSRGEVERFLNEAGLINRKYYSILPGLEMPQQMYAQGCYPNEELEIRFSPIYHNPQTVFLNEGMLYKTLIENGLFHDLANAYLFDITIDGELDNVTHVTSSLDRGRGNALATIIYRDELVEKKALFSEGIKRIETLKNNTELLSKNGINVVALSPNETADGVTMPYVKAQTALEYLRELIYQDVEAFLQEVDRFVEIIRRSGTALEITELGTIYDKAFIDLVPLNCFRVDGDYLFYDQEFAIENAPIDSVIIRALDIIYMGDRAMLQVYPEDRLLEKYGLSAKKMILRTIGADFISKLRSEGELSDFKKQHWADYTAINANRQRMNYSQAELERLYEFPLLNTEGKDIYIFGTGAYASTFFARYKDYCNIVGAIDNSAEKQGQEFKGLPIMGAEVLKNLQPDSYKVIICIKNLAVIVTQLEQMGIKFFSAFDPYMEWAEQDSFFRAREASLREKNTKTNQAESDEKDSSIKHYNKGYVAGVFDLFHVGHLNILKRAKEHCDYLIVGVVSDEQATSGKKQGPYVNEQERLEIVRACKYVDEAYVLPFGASGTRDAYMLYHFDAQFSGSDYENNEKWLTEQEWLRNHGSDLVFFSYTDSVSSTKLKEIISKK